MDSASEAFAPPPLLRIRGHETSHKQLERESAHGSNYVAVVVSPVVAVSVLVLVLVLVFLLMRVLCRAKAKNDGGNSFRKNSFDEKQVIRCGSHIKINGIGYSPDVRSCIYGSKLSFAPQVRKKGVQVFTYRELELATDGFSERNLIGNGGFGVLYRGVMGDGTAAAIKLKLEFRESRSEENSNQN